MRSFTDSPVRLRVRTWTFRTRAGWAWSRMLARLGETRVITRRDYRAANELPADALLRPPDVARAADLR
jgi:hypothetical protein